MSGYKSKENEIAVSEISASHVHCSIIYNSYNMETTGVSVNGLTKKMKM